MIELEDVCVQFDKPVLRGINLRVAPGTLYGLVGPGAAGKSVLLKTVAGLFPTSAGSVQVSDSRIDGRSEHELAGIRQRIGMLFQNNALFDFLTVAENVAFPLRQMRAGTNSEILQRVEERLSAVGLPGFGARFPSGLSGGQKKRVGVARATVTGAEVLLYDEPAAGLDPVSSQKLFDLLRSEQRASNATVLMVSSDIDRLLSVTDRVGMLVRGELIFDGTTEEALNSEDPYVRQFLRGALEGPL